MPRRRASRHPPYPASSNRRAPHIPAATQARIFKAARRLRYAPHAIARSLSTGRRQTVGTVLPLVNQTWVAVLRELGQGLAERGFQLEIIDNTRAPDGGDAAIRTLVAQRTDAIILFGGQPSEAAAIDELVRTHAAGLPVLTVGHQRGRGLPFVAYDHEQIGALATEHLLAQGCTRVGWVAGPEYEAKQRHAAMTLRHAGYVRALRQAGVAVDPDLDASIETGSEADLETSVTALLARGRPDGIVGAGHELAVRTLRLAQESGLRVPRDLAMVGVGYSPLSELVYPRLSSVGVPPAAFAQRVLPVLDVLLADAHAWDGRGLTLVPELIVRESSVRGSQAALRLADGP